MADFAAVLKKTLDGLGETTPAVRARVYDKARDTISRKLAALDPPPPASVAERQRQALEEAIASVEASFAAPLRPALDPLDELESVFSSIETQRQAPPPVRPAPPAPEQAKPPTPAAPVVAPRAVSPAPAISATPRPAPPMPRAVMPAQVSNPTAMDLRSTARDREPSPLDDEPEIGGDGSFGSEPEIDERGWRSDAEAIEVEERPRRRGRAGSLIAALLVLAVIAGGGYAAWLYRSDITTLVASFTGGGSANSTAGSNESASSTPVQPAADEDAADAPSETPATPAAPPADDVAAADPDAAPAQAPGDTAPQTATPAPGAAAQPPKFTQRLNADGSEADAGTGTGTDAVGEGTSVAQLTPADPNAPAAPAATPPAAGTPAQPGVAVAQRAIFYEERTNVAPASAETGQIVWSTVQESPGGDLPPETAVRAEATIPSKDMQLRMTVRRNGDRTLPASHIIEMIFLNSGSGGETIDNVLRVSFKSSEQDPGTPLIGNSAKIADGYFLLAMDDGNAQTQANLNLMRQGGWIDVPVVYKSGRRALFTMEKGIPGDKAFTDALAAWQSRAGG